MADLRDEFGPIAQWSKALKDIHEVAVDVMGTAIDHNGNMYKSIIDTASFLANAHLDLMIQFVSTQPKESEKALLVAGVKHPAVNKGVISKEEFYDRAEAKGHKVLAIDDSADQASRAAVHIDPKDPAVKEYLGKREYRHHHEEPGKPVL